MKSTAAIAGIAILIASVAACSSNSGSSEPGTSSCEALQTIDPLKELLIVEPSVLHDARARNDANGTWSFRRRIEELAPDDADTFLQGWFDSWRGPRQVGLSSTSPRQFVTSKLCPWLRATTANECNDDCTSCAQHHYALDVAPFRLIGIANRLDLLTGDATTNSSAAGEMRFVYALTAGPADAVASAPMKMTIIFEFHQGGVGATPRDIANAWHHLGTYPSYDEPFRAELDTAIIGKVAFRGANPAWPRQSALKQVRINEREFDWQWSQREYVVTEAGLELNTLQNTPDIALNGSAALRTFLTNNQEKVREGIHQLPFSLRGAEVTQFSWVIPGVDAATLKGFVGQTCNGCHADRPRDSNFIISPYAEGADSVSLSLYDPVGRNDELANREKSMKKVLCGGGTPPPP